MNENTHSPIKALVTQKMKNKIVTFGSELSYCNTQPGPLTKWSCNLYLGRKGAAEPFSIRKKDNNVVFLFPE
jgi:hypothetical protein